MPELCYTKQTANLSHLLVHTNLFTCIGNLSSRDKIRICYFLKTTQSTKITQMNRNVGQAMHGLTQEINKEKKQKDYIQFRGTSCLSPIMTLWSQCGGLTVK